MSSGRARWTALLLACLLCAGSSRIVFSQTPPFDASWYDANAAYVKIGILEDGLYTLTGENLVDAGIDIDAIDIATLKIQEQGRAIPFYFSGQGASLSTADSVIFIGKRNTGEDESWVYNGNDQLQSSTHFSMFTDTTYYWLSWGGEAGPRYTSVDPLPPPSGTLSQNALPDTLHLEEDLIYYFGDSSDAGQPAYTRGEGWFETSLTHVDTSPIEKKYDFALMDFDGGRDSVYVEVQISSGSLPRHRVTLDLLVDDTPLSCATCADEYDWNGYRFQRLQAQIPDDLLAGRTNLTVRVTSLNDFNSIPNRVMVDWARVVYYRQLRVDDQPIPINLPDSSPRNLIITSSEQLVAYNPQTAERTFLPQSEPGQYQHYQESRSTHWISSSSAYRQPEIIRPAAPINWLDATLQADYLIITTPHFQEAAEALAAYRQETDGYLTQIAYQQDLFDVFDYGRTSPLAIRRFVHQAMDWQQAPDFVVFLGDALRPEDGRARRPLQPWEVLSFGYAPTDAWFGIQKNGPFDWVERPAIGRIPARDAETGLFFVEKVRRYERQPPGEWQKRAMLLVGGKTEVEQLLLQDKVFQWGDSAAFAPSGMDTLRFFKNASSPLDATFQDSLRLAFREGAAWTSYFGHSAADTWEIVTDNPEDYNNADRLPVVLSMGCNTGNFAGGQFEQTDRLVYGERLVLASENGAIAHWGSSSASTITLPAELANYVHGHVFQDTMHVLGSALQQAKENFITRFTGSLSAQQVILQYGLIGDPATRLQLPDAPDLQITEQHITISPVTPIPADSNLAVTVRVQNRGLVPADSVALVLAHRTPSGSQTLFEQLIPPVFLTTETAFSVPIRDEVGTHTIDAVVDPLDRFVELDELNNAATKPHTVFSTGVTLLSPFEYEVIPDLEPILRVAIARSDTIASAFQFELDTDSSFASPDRQSATITSSTIFADWQPQAPLPDNTLFYWRIRSLDDSDTSTWVTGTFSTDTSTQGGWRQRGAFLQDTERDINLFRDSETGTWTLGGFDLEVRVTSERGNGFEKGHIVVGGIRYERVTLGYGVVVLDGKTGDLVHAESFPTFKISEEFEERFDTDSTRAVAGLDSLLTQSKQGDIVLVRTRHLGNLSGSTIQDEVKNVFRDLGSTAIDTLTYSDLWIFMTRVGAPEQSREWAVGSEVAINEIAQDTTFTFLRPEGIAVSPVIGPARAWISTQAQYRISEPTAQLNIHVVDGTTGDTLRTGLLTDTITDLADLDTETIPYLRLIAQFQDTLRQSTPQLTSWEVLFDPVPELAIDPLSSLFAADSVSESEPLTVQVAIANLSAHRAEKVLLESFITDANNTILLATTDTLQALEAQEQRVFPLEISTEGIPGKNRLRIVLSQPGLTEKHTLNNILIREFTVLGDTSPPELTLLIDDEEMIHNPEPVRNLQDPSLPFVSGQPRIEIEITDSNPFQQLNDTSLFLVQLDRRRISFSNPDLTFEPADEDANEARIIFRPDLSGRDTTHTLVIRVFDVSGNEASNSPFQVHFRVQSAVEVENLYPYPNPMHTATTFAFLLRGEDAGLLEEFRLRIYTLTGMLVREFDLLRNPEHLETGNLRIGWNKLRWDTTDADGDQIATGVYLYKVFARSDGESLEINAGSEVEKLVVIR